jgi:hypothetical protein
MIVLLVCILQLPVLSNIQEQHGDSIKHKYTVARVLDKSKEGYAEVIFLESARFYKLQHSNLHYAAYFALLKEAIKNKSVLEVRFTKPNGDIIESVKTPTSSSPRNLL